MSQKIILIYGLTGLELLSLTSMAEKAGITVRPVSDRETGLTVTQLLAGKAAGPAVGVPLLGKYALLHGFDGQEQIGTMLINRAAPGVVKAVHTDTNGSWKFSSLCAAIGDEHRTMTGLA